MHDLAQHGEREVPGSVEAHVAGAEVGVPETVDASFTLTDADTVASIGEHYLRVCEESRALASGFALDDEARHNRRGPLTLRWIHVHMIAELARHAGHGDVLREQVLAAR